MADIATIWSPLDGVGDWVLSIGQSTLVVDEHGASILDGAGGVLTSSEAAFTGGSGLIADLDLQTAVLISLFTDAEAGSDDTIPDGSSDPRGWWAGSIGSKLWLRERSKATPTLPALIKNDIEQALQWLLDDGVAAAVNVTAEYQGASTIAAQVSIYRRDGTRFALRFARLWENI